MIMNMTLQISLTLLLTIVSGRPLPAQDAVTIPSERGTFHLFLLAGQSNMAGRGKIEGQDRHPHPRIHVGSKT